MMIVGASCTMQCLRGAAHRHSYFCKELTDDVEAEVLETASSGACQSSNRADNSRESKVIVRSVNAADGARHVRSVNAADGARHGMQKSKATK